MSNTIKSPAGILVGGCYFSSKKPGKREEFCGGAGCNTGVLIWNAQYREERGTIFPEKKTEFREILQYPLEMLLFHHAREFFWKTTQKKPEEESGQGGHSKYFYLMMEINLMGGKNSQD